ncbi:DUF4190 domain-containing protein [Cellulomonas humilata]|uniref:DUF4190 domain-containing protein n=1 Tax=Cellulomonas humilata TaxID=144055 RepID=UPI001B357A91
MSNEPGGPAPVPDPYAPPDPAPTSAEPPSGYGAVPPSGYEAVRTPVSETTQPLPYGETPAAASPYGAPASTPYGQQPGTADPAPAYGAPQYGAPQYGAPAPQYGAPQYGAPAPQYGAPQYGAPQFGAPPYGAQPYGYGQQYVTPPTEGMAIASFVTSTVGLLFLGGLSGPVGLGLGIAALRRIAVNGKAGRGWAIAGIVIGAVGILWLLAIIAYIVFIVALIGSSAGSSGFWDQVQEGIEEGSEQGTGDGSTDTDSQLPDYTLRTDLTAGSCLTTYSWEYDMADTEPVDCAVPHEAEVVGLITMTAPVSLDSADEFDSAYNDAWDECDQLTEGLLPDYFSNGSIELYYPHPDDFAAGSTSAYCVYYGDEAGMTGSATAGTLQPAAAGTSS